MWGVMIDYWYATKDDTYNNLTSISVQAQVGADNDFMPADQAFDMGNDDQAFWAITALDAAETNFQAPAKGDPSWLGLAQAVYNEQIGRWDNTTCGGGIHWQVSQVVGSYHLKNTISNGALMQIAARLARYTQQDSYAKWAEKLWDWMWAIGLIDNENWSVYDNTDANLNCSSVDRSQWTYNAGTLLIATATMYNYVSASFSLSPSLSSEQRLQLPDKWRPGVEEPRDQPPQHSHLRLLPRRHHAGTLRTHRQVR
jgi:mannan endo-1,6-alpha-mannosidase